MLAWLYAPGADLAPLVPADVDLSVSAPWALDQVVDAAAPHRPRGPGAPQGRHRPGPRRQHGRGLGRPGRAAAAAQASGAVEVVGVWSHMAYADDPEHPTVRRQVEVFDEAVAAAGAAGGAAAAAAPGQLGGHPDQPGHPLRPGAPRPRRLRPLAGAAAGRPRRARAAAGDVAARPARPGQGRAGGTGRLLRPRLHDADGHDARPGAAGLRRRRAAARVRRRAGAGGRHPHVVAGPGVHGPVRRRPRTRCGAARLGGRPRRAVRRRQRRPHRAGLGRGRRDDQLRGRHPHRGRLPRRYTGLEADEPSGTVEP